MMGGAGATREVPGGDSGPEGGGHLGGRGSFRTCDDQVARGRGMHIACLIGKVTGGAVQYAYAKLKLLEIDGKTRLLERLAN